MRVIVRMLHPVMDGGHCILCREMKTGEEMLPHPSSSRDFTPSFSLIK